MKKYSILCLCALAAVSCNKNNVEGSQQPQEGRLIQDTFTLEAPATKTALDSDNKSVSWKQGDQIVYYSNTGDASAGYIKRRVVIENDGGDASVTLERNEGENFYVLCYAGISSSDMSLTSRAIDKFVPMQVLPASQSGEFDRANVCVGYVDLEADPNVNSIQLQNVTSLIQFEVDESDDIKKVEFCGGNNEPVTGNNKSEANNGGRITVDLTNSPYVAKPYGSQYARTADITKDEALNGTYYFSVFPGEFTQGFNLKLYKNPAHKYTCCKVGTTASKELVAGTIYGVGKVVYNANKYGIDMTIKEVMDANGVANESFAQELVIDDVTISVPTKDGSGNPQGYYINNAQWRLYEARGNEMTISTKNDCKIKSMTFNYTSSNGGYLFDGSKKIASDQTLTFTTPVTEQKFIIKSDSSTTSQVRIQKIKFVLEY